MLALPNSGGLVRVLQEIHGICKCNLGEINEKVSVCKSVDTVEGTHKGW